MLPADSPVTGESVTHAGTNPSPEHAPRDDRMGSTFSVQALAWIAASRHQDERAAVLLGAA